MRLLLILFPVILFSQSITNYRAIFNCIDNNKTTLLAIRALNYNTKSAFLAVDTNSLNSYLLDATKYSIIECSSDINSTRYIKLLSLSLYRNKEHPLQNDGITNIGSGIHITTDLCPSSKKGFEDRLYKAVIKNFKNPVPITIFITKRWISSHKLELEQLKKWDRDSNLTITWGNHTALHIYHPKEPLEKNFVLSKEENLTKDILDLEIELLENGIVPSIYFRFPGLVSNKDAITKVTSLGLVTIGSDAWLAKGEKPKNGSIILLHGNKNEPKGVDIFLKEIKTLSDIKSLNNF